MNKFLLFFLILASLMWGQHDEKKLLILQAGRLISQRQYERASNIYEQVLSKYEPDSQVVELYITNLIRMSKLKEAEIQLRGFENFLPADLFARLKTSILISSGDLDQARQLTFSSLQADSGNIRFYRDLAIVFEQYQQFETAIEIMTKARQAAKDDYLFTREIANDLQAIKEFGRAITEFFKLLERQKSYNNYVFSRFQQILSEDKKMISVIEKESKKYLQDYIQEVVAKSFAEIGEFEKALSYYKNLEPALLLSFAGSMKSADKTEIAKIALENYIDRETDFIKKTDATVELAALLIEDRELEKAELLLQKVYNEKSLQSSSNRYRTRANSAARILLARISLLKDENNPDVIRYLEEAKSFTYNQNQRNEIEFEIIGYHLLMGDSDAARLKLKKLLADEEQGTETFKMGYYYSYLLAMMQNDAAADSLLSEILINIPESEQAVEALNIHVVTSRLSNDEKIEFFAAWKLYHLFRYQRAIEKLEALYDSSGNEEILNLTAEWAFSAGDKDRALSLWQRDFSNEILQEYSVLRAMEAQSESSIGIEFLKKNPNSVLAPVFRKLIRKQAGK
jgi:hypothetical protein